MKPKSTDDLIKRYEQLVDAAVAESRLESHLDRFAVAYGLVAVAFCLVALAVLLGGCSPVARSVTPITPISSSHSQLTATEYDLAETEFSGDLASMPAELQAAADADCQRLLERRDAASAVVLGLVGLTGAGGLATIIPKDAEGAERKGWDIGLGATTLAAATTATILGAMVRNWSAEYERRCVSETPAVVEHPASDEVDHSPDPDGGV